MNYWLYKTEPETYSFDDLLRDKKTNWNGVRNFQARNNLKAARKGDQVLIYHSGDDKSVVGVAEVSTDPYPDPDPTKSGDWVQVDLKPIRKLNRPVTLSEIKADKSLKDLLLIRQSRLSVMPIKAQEFKTLSQYSGN